MKRIFLNLTLMLSAIFLLIPSSALAQSLTSMDDLPLLERGDQAKAQSIFSLGPENEEDDIVILYEESGENNIGELDLEASDFSAGVTVSDRVDVLETADGVDTDEKIEEIQSKAGVLAASRDGIRRALSLPNDPLASEQDYFTRIGADQVWSSPTNVPIKVALIDSGIDITHEDLAGRVDPTGIDYLNKGSMFMRDTNGHGTGVAGIIAAVSNNGIGISGVVGANNVTLLPYRIIRDNGNCLISDLCAALIDASQRPDVRVINMSLGGDDRSAVEESACRVAYNAGKVLVAPAGNENSSKVCYPAAFDTVIAVASVNEVNERCAPKDWGRNNGSNYGPAVELTAPGKLVLTAEPMEFNPTYPYTRLDGTSFSSPMVAGACAVVLAHNPLLTVDELRQILRETAADINQPGKDDETGYGLLRMDKAVLKAMETTISGDLRIPTAQYNIIAGQTKQVDYLISGANSLVWNTSNPEVATVSPTGVVSAITPGSATITASFAADPSITASCLVQVNPLEFSYRTQVENIGWMDPVGNNAIAGTTGQGLKMETLKFEMPTDGLDIITQVHVENVGDMAPVPKGIEAGTVGLNQGIEAVTLSLAGDNSSNFSVYYRTHVENHGWTEWASNGQWCGSQGHNLQLEAIQVYVAPNGVEAPHGDGNVDWTLLK